MRLTARNAVGFVVGGVLLGALVSAGAQEGSPPQPPPARGEAPERRPAQGHFGPKHAIRSESVFPGVDGGPVRTVRTDRGELKSVDGRTLTIAAEDGTSVKVTVDDQTRIHRDGARAQAGDLEPGDQVFTVRVKEGDGGYRTRGVNALSKERYAEMKQRREECRNNREACKAEKMRRRRLGGSGGGAADPRTGTWSSRQRRTPRPDGGRSRRVVLGA